MRNLIIPLPHLGLGMAALGRPGYINLDRDSIFGNSDSRSIEDMQTQANLVLDSLFQYGRTGNGDRQKQQLWVDCARSYGLSEKFLGEYLRKKNIAPEEVYVSSKWGYSYVADWKVQLEAGKPHEVKDHSVENFLKQFEESMNILGDYINLYQIHSATFESGVLENNDIHKALHKCKKENGISIGLSASSPIQDEVIQKAMTIEVDGMKLFDSVQCTFNLLEQRPAICLLKAHEAGIDVIVKEGMANGRVLQNPVVQEYSDKLSCSPDQLALACILAQPFQPRVLSGAVTPDQLGSNLRAEAIAKRLRTDPVLLAEIMKKTRMDSETYWSDRSMLAWN